MRITQSTIAGLAALSLATSPVGAQTLGGATRLGGATPGGALEPFVDPGFQPRMGEPVRGLTDAELARFVAGRTAFNSVLPVNEGRGPIFNDTSCGNCHSQPDVGGSSASAVTRFGKAAAGMNPFDPLAHLGGSLQQVQADDMNCVEVVPPEADVVINRLTPHTFGSGLLEAVNDADILVREMNPPPGVSGFARSSTPVEGGGARVNKFGWKGGVPTVFTFSADASLNEMGLTSVFFPAENAPNGDAVLLGQCDMVADPEDFPDGQGFTKIDRFTDFQRFLAAPPQTPRSGMTGEMLFEQVGCAACHVTDSYVTDPAPESALSGVAIKPYSDFLLHDMGSLGDGIVDGTATENEMMTRALWGLQQRDPLMHDGRSTGGTPIENLEDAIAEHDGEAAASRAAFQALTPAEQGQVVAFLQSLGQAEFDWERDHDVDVFDWFFVEQILTGPLQAPAYGPDDFAAIADVDVDGDVDLRDFGVLQRAWTGQ